VASADGSRNAEQLTSVPTSQVQVPGTWTRDGKTLVLTQFEGGAGNIATIRRGEQSATPFVASNADERDPALSFDDRWVAYSSNAFRQRDSTPYSTRETLTPVKAAREPQATRVRPN
jgi:hypothetical protein